MSGVCRRFVVHGSIRCRSQLLAPDVPATAEACFEQVIVVDEPPDTRSQISGDQASQILGRVGIATR